MSASAAVRPRSWAPLAAPASVLGGLFAVGLMPGAVAFAAVAFVPLVMVSVSVGVALWIPALFVVPGLVTSLMFLVIATAWLGSLVFVRPGLGEVLPGQRRLVGAFALLLAWLALTLVWARSPELGWMDLRGWMIAAGTLLVVATTTTTPGRLRLVLAAFLVGAVLSVVLGVLAGTPVTPPGSPPARFAGRVGNPNDLAAQLLPVIVLAVALAADRRRLIERLPLAACALGLTVALAATQSRGGLVAAAVTIVAAPIIYNRYRRYVMAAAVLAALAATVWFAFSPRDLSHATSFGDGGAGRTTLWAVAWHMANDYAPVGVGLGNFRPVSLDYVRQPGLLPYIGQVEAPHVVHDTYLQLLAETGVPGLGLFLVAVGACLAAARRAVVSFERKGRSDLAALARAVLLAVVSVLAAQVFQSNGYDVMLWILLALGPAMLTMAHRR